MRRRAELPSAIVPIVERIEDAARRRSVPEPWEYDVTFFDDGTFYVSLYHFHSEDMIDMSGDEPSLDVERDSFDNEIGVRVRYRWVELPTRKRVGFSVDSRSSP